MKTATPIVVDNDIVTQERTVTVPITVLADMAQEGGYALVFLPDGRVWFGEEDELTDLAAQVKGEMEAELNEFSQDHELWKKSQAETAREATMRTLTMPELEALIGDLKQKEEEL